MSPATIFQIHLAPGYVHAVPPDLDVHPIVDNYSIQNGAGVRIQNRRQVQPALACWDVGHIAEPASIGPLGFKAPPD